MTKNNTELLEKILDYLFDGYTKKQTAEILKISISKLNKVLDEYRNTK